MFSITTSFKLSIHSPVSTNKSGRFSKSCGFVIVYGAETCKLRLLSQPIKVDDCSNPTPDCWNAYGADLVKLLLLLQCTFLLIISCKSVRPSTLKFKDAICEIARYLLIPIVGPLEFSQVPTPDRPDGSPIIRLNSQLTTRGVDKAQGACACQGVMMASSNGVFDQGPEPSHGNPAARRQTTHIRACTNCVRAKAKCSVGVDVKGRCERYGLIFIETTAFAICC